MSDAAKDIRLFERAAAQRLEAAQFLFEHGFNLDATYLAGYTVECALKAMILKATARNQHADMLERLTKSGAQGHDFEYLLGILKITRGKKGAKDRESFGKMTLHLKTVAVWSTSYRYRVGSLKQREAAQFLDAAQQIFDWCRRS